MVWLVSPDLERERERERKISIVEEKCCGRLENVDKGDGRVGEIKESKEKERGEVVGIEEKLGAVDKVEERN